jgi:hypothetical protein
MHKFLTHTLSLSLWQQKADDDHVVSGSCMLAYSTLETSNLNMPTVNHKDRGQEQVLGGSLKYL